VDLVGIEPTTSSMPWKRAPSCATGPHRKYLLILADWGAFVKPKVLRAVKQSGYFLAKWNQRVKFSSCI
jgi:hypothetical protein